MATADQKEREFLPFKRLFREIQLQSDVGLKLHKGKRTEWDHQFYAVFKELCLLLDPVQEYQEQLATRCHEYDFINSDGTRVKGNGFRSLIVVLQKLLERVLENLQKCSRERGGVFYSVSDHLSSLTAVTRALQGMELLLENAVLLMKANPPPVLMNDGDVCESLMKLACTEDVSRDAFYGRCLGFQYSQNLKPILQFLAISMASYEEWHSSNKEDPVKQLLNSLWKGSKYLQHPTQRGIKIAQVTDNPNIFFAKAFWSLTEREAIKTAVKFVSQTVDVSKTIEIPAKNIVIKSISGEEVTFTPPFSDIGYKPVSTTLISFKWRQGQPSPSYGRKPTPAQPAKNLIVHLHGGGFVAQSSKSHESYLRWWSRELDCPILSVDYSLAPEAPYPRALEECVFVYAWVLNNFETLGTTAEKIIFVGDSAGGNLVITTSMKLKSLGIRLPDHVFSYYPATIVRSCATPSRFLSVIDPLLPCGIMISCLQAYTGNVPDDTVIERRNEIRKKLLISKGYIIPSEETATVNSGEKTTFMKLTGMQRSKSLSSKPPTNSSPVKRPSPPTRPPLPKGVSVDTVSNKPKPQRPPPPCASITKTTSVNTESNVSFSSLNNDTEPKLEDTPTNTNEDTPTLTNEDTPTMTNEDTPTMTNVDVTEDDTPSKTEVDTPSEEPETKSEEEKSTTDSTNTKDGFTDIDLTDQSQRNLSEETDQSKPVQDNLLEETDTLTPLQSIAPQPDSQPPNTIPKDHTGTFAPTSSVAVFFPPNNDSSNDELDIRLGHRQPTKNELLSENEIETLTRELLDSYKDSETTMNPYVSPSLAPDDLLIGLPPIDIIVCSLDPLLDDGITFAQRLKSVNQTVTLTVLEGISHGFLCLAGADNIVQAQLKCTRLMKSVMSPLQSRLSKNNI